MATFCVIPQKKMALECIATSRAFFYFIFHEIDNYKSNLSNKIALASVKSHDPPGQRSQYNAAGHRLISYVHYSLIMIILKKGIPFTLYMLYHIIIYLKSILLDTPNIDNRWIHHVWRNYKMRKSSQCSSELHFELKKKITLTCKINMLLWGNLSHSATLFDTQRGLTYQSISQ